MKYILFILLTFFHVQCSHKLPQNNLKPRVVTTIAPYVTIVKEIVQDTLEVKSLFPPNVDAHSYEPSHKQIEDLKQSKIWFYLGEPQEKKLLSVSKSKNTTQLVNLTKNISMISEGLHKDFHIWLSPNLMKTQANTIFTVLINTFPDHEKAFTKNYQKLLVKLENLQQTIRENLGNKSPTFIISHNALAYFCRDFGCKAISLDAHEKLSAQELKKLMLTIEKENPCLFIMIPQHLSKSAKVLAKKLKIPVINWNPYEKNYFENMQTLAKAFYESCH